MIQLNAGKQRSTRERGRISVPVMSIASGRTHDRLKSIEERDGGVTVRHDASRSGAPITHPLAFMNPLSRLKRDE